MQYSLIFYNIVLKLPVTISLLICKYNQNKGGEYLQSEAKK